MTREEFKANLELLIRIKELDRVLKQAGEPLLIEMEHPQAPLYLELETAFIKLMEEYNTELINDVTPLDWLLNIADIQNNKEFAIDVVMKRYDNFNKQ